MQKTVQQNKLGASEAVNLVEKHDSDMQRVAGEINTLEDRLKVENEELERIRDDLKGKTQVFSDQITQKQKELEPWNEKINQKQSAIAVAQSELDILNQKRNASQKSIQEIQGKIDLILESRQTKEAEYNESRLEKAKLEKEVQRSEAQLEKMIEQEAKLRNILSGSRQKADEAKMSLQASVNQGAVLAGLMRLKESGRIDGFHVSLSLLFRIDLRANSP